MSTMLKTNGARRASLRALAFTAAAVSCALAACDSTVPIGSEEHVEATGSALTTFETCQQDAVSRGVTIKQQGGTDVDARKALETAFALCEDPARSPENAAFLGTFNADFARLGSMFLAGRLSLAEYRAAQSDRSRKYNSLLKSRAGQVALNAGDADGDLVPDRSDRCPGTTYGVGTDDAGCQTTPTPKGDSAISGALAGTTVLYNPSCKDAPVPLTPVPLEWGRGHQTKPMTDGYNLWVSKSGDQPAGCELFYEFELRFTNPGLAGAPPVLYAHMVMREGEDLLADPSTATFGLPAMGPLSPGRTTARDAMGSYSTLSWKVRAVNGSQLASPWSAVRTAGPSASGVSG